jgi:Na+/proline symporter
MKQIWFKRTGWFYIPVHPFGFIVTFLAIAFMAPIVLAIDRNAHSVTDELYDIFIYATCTAFWWKWVTEKTSSRY